MKIETDLEPKILRIIGLLDKTDVEKERALRAAALDALALVQNRIQQRGMGTSGPLVSKSTTKFGAYSRNYGKYRSSRGFQTGKIDWTLNGDLWRNWQIIKSDTREALVGFTDDEQGKIAGYIEEMNGEGFGLTAEEKEMVLQTVRAEIRQGLEL